MNILAFPTARTAPPADLEMIYRGRAIEITPLSPAGVDFLNGDATLVLPSDDFQGFLAQVDAAGLVH